ncbi:hypothetical protein RB601_001305, partial [Gaeumannomyces tritici]
VAHLAPGTAPSSPKEAQDQDQDLEKDHEKTLLELEKLKTEPEKQQHQEQHQQHQQRPQARLHDAQEPESQLTQKHLLLHAPTTTQGLPAAAAPVEFNLPSPAATTPIESATISTASVPSTPVPTVASTTVITSYPTAHDRGNTCITVTATTTTTTAATTTITTTITTTTTPTDDLVQLPGTADFVSVKEATQSPQAPSQPCLTGGLSDATSTAPSSTLEANGNEGFTSSYSPAPMSNAPPPHGNARQHHQQHLGYPGQPAYSQPSMNPGGPYGYPAVTTQAPDPYRTPQPLPPNPALALPSMRSLDPLQHQHQHQHQHQQAQHPQHQQHPHPHPHQQHPHPHQHHPQAMGMTPQMSAYYPQPAHLAMHPYAMHHADLRMAFPMGDPRLSLSGGRHKKDIKRRTKTGCLTCRKRRIKCDETHPTCNNCKKSKRDCAGYDPIFKQTPPGPSTIQPAPNHGAAPTAPPPAQPLQQPQLEQHSHSQDQQTSSLSGGPPTSSTNSPVSSPYGHQPTVVPSSYPFVQSHQYDTSSSTLASNVDYSGGAIDPALDTARKMKVDDLVALGGHTPPLPQSLPTKEVLDEIIKLYYEIYVPGLTAFFETSWFNFRPDGHNPISVLSHNTALMSLLASFLAAAASPVKIADAARMAAPGIIETRVVWGLASLAYSVPAATNPAMDEPLAADDAAEARNRVSVFEALLSGTYLTNNPCIPPPRRGDVHRIREAEFWYYLAEYLRLGEPQPQGAGPSQRQRDAALTRIRNLLDGRENRDVLYSMAVLRELAPRYPAGYENSLPQHLDEGDPRNKLAVAAQFIRDEARASSGTTNVVRRLAELAAKAFVTPGVNVSRRPT